MNFGEADRMNIRIFSGLLGLLSVKVNETVGLGAVEFLVDGELIRYATQFKTTRFTLEIKIEFDLESATVLKNDITTILTSWGNYPPFKSDNTLEKSYFLLLKPSVERLVSLTTILSQILTYTVGATSQVPSNNCSYAISGITRLGISAGVQAIRDAWKRCSETWTPEEIRADHSKDGTLRNVIQTINTEITTWERLAANTLSTIDSLASGFFPLNIMGRYQVAGCLNHMVGEELKVMSCRAYTSAYSCLIEVLQPELVHTAFQIIPVHYGNIRLIGEKVSDIFIRKNLQSEISLLDCPATTIQDTGIFHCTPKPWKGECADALVTGDLPLLLKGCNWTREPSTKVGTFLLDGSLLVQGKVSTIQIKAGDRLSTVATETPARVYSETEIVISQGKEVHKYPGMKEMSGVSVLKSKLTSVDIAMLESALRWKDIWANISYSEYIDMVLTSLHLIFVPLSIWGIVIGRKVDQAKKLIKQEREKRRRNFNRNKLLLEKGKK